MPDPIVVSGLGKVYGRTRALHDVSLHVAGGRALGLIGANGAGKSTLLRVLVNLEPPTTGRATLLGSDTRLLTPQIFTRVGYLSEAQTLPGVPDLQALLDYCRPFYPRWDDALVTRLLDRLDIPASTPMPRASRGTRMKAALVATLAFHPDVLILDEPLEGLDPLTREQVVDGLLELVTDEGTTLLLASHDLDVLERLLDDVAMLHDGQVVFEEPLDALQERYRLLAIASATPLDPALLPAGCLDVRATPAGLECLVTDFDEQATPADLAARFPGATVHVNRPALREAFVAHARARRAAARTGARP